MDNFKNPNDPNYQKNLENSNKQSNLDLSTRYNTTAMIPMNTTATVQSNAY